MNQAKANPLASSPANSFSEQSVPNKLGNHPTAAASYSFNLLGSLTMNNSEATDNTILSHSIKL